MAPVADPWDAPYFGAPIYLTYQPTLATAFPTRASLSAAPITAVKDAAPTHATTNATRWDPWDAPYFGAPVYFAYRPSALPEPLAAPAQPFAPVAAAIVSASAESERTLVAIGAAVAPAAAAAGAPTSDATHRPYIGAAWRQTWFGRLFGGERRG